jgi:hypothetical protein
MKHGRNLITYTDDCKKILQLARSAANGVAEMELGRDSRREEATWLTVKYWQRIMHMDIQDPVRLCYEWQKGNMRFLSWAKNIKRSFEGI